MNDPVEQLRGFEISDCAVRSDTHFYLLAEHVYELGSGSASAEGALREAIRIAVFFPDREPARRWAFRTLRHIDVMRCAVAESPMPQLVAVAMDGQVFVAGSGYSAFEERIHEHRDGPLRGAVRDVFSIDGQVYVVQGNRGVCRRSGLDSWESLCAGLPVPRGSRERDEIGFSCATGVRHDSIYAGGARGDLWRFDGSVWTEQKLPFHRDTGLDPGFDIVALCCVDPGSVYVACRNGNIHLGTDSRWQTLSAPSIGRIGPRIKSMVAYQGRVWATSGSGFWIFSKEGVEQVVLPEGIRPGDSLAARGKVLLMAGRSGAAYFDGARWHRIL